ncbi:MAG: hypothetical protein ACO3K7_03225 [Candidatus Marinamargulisbacteria bacterium]
MARTFSDRLLLRKMKRVFQHRPFHAQGNYLSKLSSIAPEWLHQSRKNYRYIYTNHKSYWPDWAKSQFTPQAHAPSTNEYACLNTTFQSGLNYHPDQKKHPPIHINENGFVSFPTRYWGITFQASQYNDPALPLFNNKMGLNESKLSITGHNHLFGLNISIDMAFNQTTLLQITLQNPTNTPIPIQLHTGILPFTNDGVGFISSIQYTSHQQFIVNDNAIISSSEQPKNIICTDYNSGSIFNVAHQWEMILHARCSQALASGLMLFEHDIPAQSSKTISFEVHHLRRFLTPLLPSLSRDTYPKLSSYALLSQQSKDITFPVVPRRLNHINLGQSYSKKLNTLIKNNDLTHTSTHPLESLDVIYYSLQSQLQLGYDTTIQPTLSHIIQWNPHKVTQLAIFSAQQCTIMRLILTYSQLISFKADTEMFTSSIILKLQKGIQTDPFLTFLKRLRITQFNHILEQSQGHHLLLKLIVFSVLLNKMIQFKWHTPSISAHHKQCQHYMTMIFHQTDILTSFITSFHENTYLPFGIKILIIDVFFRRLPTTLMYDQSSILAVSHIKNSTALSTKNKLLATRFQPDTDQWKTLSNYLDYINPLGIHTPTPFTYDSFHYHPKKTPVDHPIFLATFFDFLFQIQDQSLIISAPLWFSTCHIDSIKTIFGTIAIQLTTKENSEITVQLTHAFHFSPQKIILKCPPNYSWAGINTNDTIPIHHNTLTVPLNATVINIFKNK